MDVPLLSLEKGFCQNRQTLPAAARGCDELSEQERALSPAGHPRSLRVARDGGAPERASEILP